ncbi:Odorant receptor Or74 [Rhyzopertha dominica]|nr:Odorant receptor Or74 [Rhyzopertha dominica]
MVDFGYKSMEENYLGSIKKVCMIYYEYPALRIISKYLELIFFAYHGMLTVLAIIYKWDVHWLFVAAVLVTVLHRIQTVYLVDGLYDDIVSLDEEMNKSFWSIEAASEELLAHFKRIFYVLKACERLLCITVPLIGCTVALIRFFPKWPIAIVLKLLYNILYVADLCFGSVITFEFHIIFFYYCSHAYIQTSLLGQYFSNIDNDIEHLKYDNRNRIIRKRLIRGIKQHEELKRFADQLKKVYNGKRLLLPFSLIMIGMPVWIIWIITEGTFIVTVAVVIFLYLIITFSISGELFTIGYEECVRKLYECNWYDWNQENKRLLLLFVSLANQEQAIKILQPFTLRLSGLVRYMKTIYSTVALLKSVYQ